MKGLLLLMGTALASCLFLGEARGAAITWISTTGGNWNNPTNWNPNQVPGPSDTAFITASGNYTVTQDESTAVSGLILGAGDSSTQTLILTGQSLQINEPSVVNAGSVIYLISGSITSAANVAMGGTLICSGSTLSGVFTITTNGVVNVTSSPFVTQPVSFSSLTLTSYGTVIWSNSDIQCQSSCAITNYGLWDAQTNNTFYGVAGNTTFANYGIVRKDGGTTDPPNYETIFDDNVIFNNYGTLDAEVGVLAILAGSSVSGSVMNAATNAYTGFGSDYFMTGNVTFTGAGGVNGALNGSNAVINGTVTTTYITLTGSLTMATNSVLCFSPLFSQPIIFDGTMFTNYGTVLWTSNDLYAEDSPQICNYGLWDAQYDNTFHGAASPYGGTTSGTTTFNNYGTLRVDGPANNETYFDGNVIFNNFGTLDVETRNVEIAAGTGNGSFYVASNTLAFLDSFILTGNSTFNGPGGFDGEISGSNAIVQGSLTYYGATLSGSLTVASNSVLSFSTYAGPVSFNGTAFTNYGTVLWLNGDLAGNSSPQIDNYGLWDSEADNQFFGADAPYGGPAGGTTTFNNYGTLRVDGPANNESYFDGNVYFDNYGALDVETRGIEISTGIGNGLFYAAGNTVSSLDNFELTGNPTFSGPGLFGGAISGSNGIIHGALLLYYGSLSGSLTVASNSVLYVSPSPLEPVSFAGTTFTNYGTVVWTNDDLYGQYSPQIFNYGLWDAQTGNTFHGNAMPFGGSLAPTNATTFNNYGTLRVDGPPASESLLDGSVLFDNSGTLDVESRSIEISTGIGNGLFNAASNTLSSLDSFILTGNPTFSGPGLFGGAISGSNGIIHGALLLYYGSLSGCLTIASNSVLCVSPSPLEPVSFAGTTFTNYGTVIWTNNDLYGQYSPQIFNYGLWDAQTGNTFHGDALPFGGTASGTTAFNNYGTLRVDGTPTTESLLDGNVYFDNYGTLDVETRGVEISTGIGDGLFDAAANTASSLDNFVLTGNPMFSGPGMFGGAISGSNGIIHGALLFYYGSLSGSLTVASNSVLCVSPSPLEPVSFAGTTFTNYGTVIWTNDDLYGQSSPQIYNYGLWEAQSGNTFHGDAIPFGGGSLTNGPTTFNNYGTFCESAGQTTFDSNTAFNNYNKANIGNGDLALNGSYSLASGQLNFSISSSSSFGSLFLDGNGPLAGQLNVTFNGYTPAAGNAFPLVEYGPETGTFSSLGLPLLPPTFSWQPDYGSTVFTLTIASALPPELSAAANASGNSFSFSWNGLLGRTYQVQYTTNLASVLWMNLGSAITGTNGPASISDTLDGPQKYYRLQVQ